MIKRLVVARPKVWTRAFIPGTEGTAARIADDRLDAPVRLLGALDTQVGYHPRPDGAILPQTEKPLEMIRL